MVMPSTRSPTLAKTSLMTFLMIPLFCRSTHPHRKRNLDTYLINQGLLFVASSAPDHQKLLQSCLESIANQYLYFFFIPIICYFLYQKPNTLNIHPLCILFLSYTNPGPFCKLHREKGALIHSLICFGLLLRLIRR